MTHGRSWQCHVFEVPTREASVNRREGKDSDAIRVFDFLTSRTIRSIGGGCRWIEVIERRHEVKEWEYSDGRTLMMKEASSRSNC
jgi:hypothetical protein